MSGLGAQEALSHCESLRLMSPELSLKDWDPMWLVGLPLLEGDALLSSQG